jgi:hypothetical protein
MVTIYTDISTNTKRLAFVANHLFTNILGTKFQLLTDTNAYLQQSGVCINYSDYYLNHGLHILPHGLLSETDIHPVRELKESTFAGVWCLFENKKSDFPFDIFAAAFYLLSLYEEYFPTQLDEHGRFDHRESLLFKRGQLETPVVDRWAYLLKEALTQKGYSQDEFPLRKYRPVFTYDIDFPFHRSLKIFGFFWKKKNDKYAQALRMIHAYQTRWQHPYYLFILLGRYPDSYYKNLAKQGGVTLGLHPSYKTLKKFKRLKREKAKLEKKLGQQVTVTRQHYLRMQTPDTFQDLQQAGFREDFTLAFAKAPGFRSGTAVPYLFYDLQKDELSRLNIRPLVMMESTFVYHLKYTPNQALEKIKHLIDACKQSGGDYVSLWHNSNIAGEPEKNPWIDVYIQSSEYAVSKENS